MNEPNAGIVFLYLGILAGIPATLALIISIAAQRGPWLALLAGALGYFVFRLVAPALFAPLIENDFDRKFFDAIYGGVLASVILATLVAVGVRKWRPGVRSAVLAPIAIGASLVGMLMAMVGAVMH